MVGLRMVVVGLLIYHRIPAARWGGVEAGDAILDVTGGGPAGCEALPIRLVSPLCHGHDLNNGGGARVSLLRR
jgi:hypothetical protein